MKGTTLTLRVGALLPGALIGAGFFIFFSALQGGAVYSWMESRLGRKAVPRSADQAPAILILGQSQAGATPAQRRLELARDLEALRAADPAAVVLEAWLDEESQRESALLLDELLEDAGRLKGRSARMLEGRMAELRAGLDADRRLAEAIRACPRVILPAAVEPLRTPSARTATSSVWDKGAYQVIRKGRGVQRLQTEWRIVRAPLRIFREAAYSVAAVPTAIPGQGSEIPAVFQIRRSWVNGLGLEAYRSGLGLPQKALRFVWRGEHLGALELQGRRMPLTPAGMLIPGDFPDLPAITTTSLRHAAFLADLKGKVVFYQPWPEWLSQAGGFELQRRALAALASGALLRAPAQPADIWLWAALGVLCFASCASRRGPLRLGGLLFALFFVAWDARLRGAAWARPAAAALGGGLAGWVWGAENRRLRGAACRFQGACDERWAEAWQKRLERSGAAGFEGLYAALRPAPQAVESWARRFDVLCEWPGDDRGPILAFAIPLAENARIPVEALKSLRAAAGSAALAFCRGQLAVKEIAFLGSRRWSVEGEAKQRCLAMLREAGLRETLMPEEQYPELREHVKIQLISRPALAAALPGQKILNVLEFL